MSSPARTGARRARSCRAIPGRGKVIVDGVNVAKRHQKPTRATMQGGIIDKDMPIPVANVAVVCSTLRQADPRRLPLRRRRHQGPDLHEVREVTCDAPPPPPCPRLKAALRRRDPCPAQGRPRARQHHGGPPPREDRRSTWASARPSTSKSLLDGAVADLTIITGQKPVVTKAKKSIAGFKLREGNAIGAKVTLRGDRMWEFFDRLDQRWPSPASATSGACPPVVRRPRQLHVRRHRAADLPGDRLRQGRRRPRHGHHDRDHRPHQRRGQGPARRLRLPVPTRGGS